MSKSSLYILFVFLLCKYVESDLYYDVLRTVDPCEAFCEKTYLSSDGKHDSCCRRGCRFFSLIYLVEDRTHVDLNTTRSTCQSSCTEAYADTKDCNACNQGCTSMAKQKQAELLSQIDWSLYVEDGNMIMLEPGDLEPDDVLTDPGLRRQLRKNWALDDDDRLPETHIRTLPVNADNEGVRDAEPLAQETSGWLDCTALRSGVPLAVVGAAVLLPVVVAVLLWLVPSWRTTLEEVAALGDYKDPLDMLPKYSLHVEKI